MLISIGCTILILICLSLLASSRRHVPHHSPQHGNLNETSAKITYKIEQYEEMGTSKHRRNLIIYYLGNVDPYVSGLDVVTNNIKLFVSALMTHLDGSPQEAFYLFNVADGRDNPLRNYLPRRHPNVGVIDWLHAKDENEMNSKLIKLLGLDLLNSFGAVFFLNNDVRGPLVYRNNGEWIWEFRKLLDSNNVGMVGPVVSCENIPHVSTYMYAWRTKLFNLLWKADNFQEQLANSDFVRSSGYNISSMLYHRKYRTPYFNGKCVLTVGSKLQPTMNPVTWCNVLPKEVVFMYWGGEAVRSLGYICEHTLAMMRDALADIADAHPEMGLIVPETLVGGRMYEMYKQYNEELYMDRIRPQAIQGHLASIDPSEEGTRLHNTSTTAAAEGDKKHRQHRSFSLFPLHHKQHSQSSSDGSKSTTPGEFDDTEVCFAVRTAFMHDSAEEVRSRSMFEDVDIEGFILSLLRQTNPAWVAYFFVTDTNPFEERLQEILAKHQDPRLVYTPIPAAYRVPFSTEDAGYTATDYVMSKLIRRSECRWLSATNADNVYGSGVVDRVLHVQPEVISKKLPDMVLNPIDSRNFMWADYLERRDLTRGMGVEQTWTDYCTGLEAALLFNSYTYTVQPNPVLGKVDLASVFYSRAKYAAANIAFGNFTNPARYPCLGCQDGYLTQYLARNLRWTYTRLSVDGLRSIIFHGPSPTLCLAAGNVWFDYPSVNKVGCISQQTVRMLSYHNPKYYDWIHLNFKSNKVCLRLSRTGFFAEIGQ